MATPTVTHKDYGERGSVVSPDKLTPYEADEKFNPREHGGILRRLGSKALMPRSYRPGQETLVYEKDIQELNLGKANRVYKSPEAMLAELSGTGSEFEFHVSKVRRRTARNENENVVTRFAARPGDALGLITALKSKFAAQSQDNKSASHELWTTMCEIGTKGRVDSLKEHKILTRELLRQADEEAEARNLLFYPGSSSPVREPYVEGARDEVNPDPYVTQMARKIMRLMRVRRFTGAGFQVHKEFNNARTGLFAIVHGEHVMSVLHAITTSSSADGGNINNIDPQTAFRLADKSVRKDPEMKELLAPKRWHSLRRLQQELEIGTGGSMKFLPPIEALYDKSMNALVKFLDKRSRHELVSRSLGRHSNRLRVDAPGTIEVTNFDTAGYRLQRTDLLTETTQKFYTCLEWLADTNPTYQDFIFQKFGLLFPERPFANQKEMALAVRETRHNNMRIAHQAQHAEIMVPGHSEQKRASVGDVMDQLQEFLHLMGTPLSAEGAIEMWRAMQSPPKDATFDDYYQKGLGNFSEYFNNHYEKLINNGHDHKKALKMVTAEAGLAWRRYIRSDFALAG